MGKSVHPVVFLVFVFALTIVSAQRLPQWQEQISGPTDAEQWFFRFLQNCSPPRDGILPLVSQISELDTLSQPFKELLKFHTLVAKYRQARFEEADQEALQWIQEYPSSPYRSWVFLLRGEIAFRQERFADAYQHFRRAEIIATEDWKIRGDSTYAFPASYSLFWSSVALMRQGLFEDAARILVQYRERFPHFDYADECLLFLGIFEETQFRYEAAAQRYKQLITSYPESNVLVAAHLRAAQVALYLRETKEVLRHIEAARTILQYPQNYEKQDYVNDVDIQLTYLEAEVLGLLQRHTEAEQKIREAIEQYPQSSYLPYLHFSLGWNQLNLRHFSVAEQEFQRVIFDTLAPSFLRAASQFYLAVTYRMSGDTNRALRILQGITSQEVYPFRGAALLELGQIYYKRRDFLNARKVLERAEKEAATIRIRLEAILLLGSLYLSENLYDAAAKTYQKGKEILEKTTELFLPEKDLYRAEILYRGGIAFIGNNQPQEAVNFFHQFLSFYPDDPRRHDVLFWIAESYYHTGLYRNALAYYTGLLEQFPATSYRADILYGMGWSYFQLRNFSQAVRTFERLIREFPQSHYVPDALARKADALYLSGKYAYAANAYREVVAKAPNTDLAQYCGYQVAQSLYRLKDYDGVLRETERYLRMFPYGILADDALYLHGWTLFQLKEYEKAIAAFEKFIKQYPNSPLLIRVEYAIADAYYNMEQYEKAIEQYTNIINNYPNSPYAVTALESLQYCYILTGKKQEGEQIIQEYIQKFPELPLAEELYLKRADVLYSAGEYASAAEELNIFLKQFPESKRIPEVLFWLAKSYLSMAQGEGRDSLILRADAIFRDITQYHKDDPVALQAWLERANIAKRRGNITVADSLWTELYARYPHTAEAQQGLFEQAVLMEQIGDTVRAFQLYRKLARNHPESEYGARSQFRIAVYYRDKKMYDSAQAAFSKLVHRKDELGAQALYWIGELFLRQKSYENAATVFQEVKLRFSQYEHWYILAVLNLGYCYERLERYPLAAEQYRLVLALRGDDEYAQTAQSRLNRIKEKLQ